MKNSNTSQLGFTLIELLVVVLVIGILAAVALPQYQKAVEKAHAAEAWTVVRALKNAQEALYVAQGEYSTDVADLDINVNPSQYYDFEISSTSVNALEKNAKYTLGIRLTYGSYNAGEAKFCGWSMARGGTREKARRYCADLGADISKYEKDSVNTWIIP